MHTGLYNRNRRGRNTGFVDPGELLEDGLQKLGLDELPGGDDLLMEYVTELMNWNRIYNLTSVRKPADIITRHILDSLSVLPYLHGDRRSTGRSCCSIRSSAVHFQTCLTSTATQHGCAVRMAVCWQ
jgi:hypothetical protein